MMVISYLFKEEFDLYLCSYLAVRTIVLLRVYSPLVSVLHAPLRVPGRHILSLLTGFWKVWLSTQAKL